MRVLSDSIANSEKHLMKRLAYFLLLLAPLGCGGSNLPANGDDAVETYARIVAASYQDAHARAQSLGAAIDTLVATPSAVNLTAAQDAWVAARVPYLQTEAYRFYDGPIDDPDTGPEGLLNAWPLDEAYIDYVVGNASAGLVNDTSFAITAASLEERNELGGEQHIASGYHAVEFLLWGQDLSLSQPGQRAFGDYLTGGGATAPNGDRRAVYLDAAAVGIVANLATLIDAWSEGSDTNYRASFEDGVSTKEALRRIFTGLVIFSANELGGERLVGIETGDPNDEHSCFSDTTRTDFIEDQRGVQNVFLGRYVRVDGTTVEGVGLDDVIAARDPVLAEEIRTRIATSLSLAEAAMSPFEQEFQAGNTAGRARLEALRTSLQTQGELLEEAMDLLDLEFTPPAE